MSRSLSKRVCLFIFFLVMIAGASRVHAENYAFLVAVQDYDVKDLKPLQFTRGDILELAKLLKQSGFNDDNVVVMTDKAEARRYMAESDKIRTEFDLLLAGLRESDTLVVAFSGHGVQFEGEDKNYYCPADADLEDPKRARLIALSEIYEKLKGCPAQRKLLLVDACRNDPLSPIKKSRQTVHLKSVTRPQTEAVPKGLVALFSCAAGQESYEWPELKHGVFFHHVLAGWKGAADDGDREVTLNEVVNYATLKTQTFARTTLKAAQTPQLKSDFEGTWILRKIAAAPVEEAVELANGLFERRSYQDSLKEFNRALVLDSKYASALCGRAATYNRLKKYDLALADADEALKLDPKSARAHYERGFAFRGVGKHDEAIGEFSRAIELDPKHFEAYYSRGVAYANKGERERGLADCNKAIEINPHSAKTFVYRGVAYQRLKEFKLALADYAKAIEVDPKFLHSYINRAFCHQLMGNKVHPTNAYLAS